MSTLQDFYPTFEQVDVGRRDLVLPEIKEQKLRDALMEDATLSSEILELILKGLRLDPKAPVPDPKTGSALTVICTAELPKLALTMGAVAYSNQLAMQAANDIGALESAGIGRPVIRHALRFRSFSLSDAELKVFDTTALQTEGYRCLECWLEAQSNDIARLTKLRLPILARSHRSALQKEARVQVAQAVLDDLASGNEAAA